MSAVTLIGTLVKNASYGDVITGYLFILFYFIGFSSVNIFIIHLFKLATVDSAKKRRTNPLISIAVHIC